MPSANDVAAAILARRGSLDTYSLQKLVYYAQAWYLAWYDEPLFPQDVEAWAQGPVVREVFNDHRGRRTISELPHGDPAALSDDQARALDAVLSMYPDESGLALSKRTHAEVPWLTARHGLAPGEASDRQISQDVMRDYYRNYGSGAVEVQVEEPDKETVERIASGDSKALTEYINSHLSSR